MGNVLDTSSESGGIGSAVLRKEDLRLTVGRGMYSDDRAMEHQCYAVMLRSPHAHAAILSIEKAAAAALPGVLAVLTGADLQSQKLQPIPHSPWSMHPADIKPRMSDSKPPIIPPHLLLPLNRARFVGEAVACVVAETAAIAQAASEHVVVDYDPLESVTNTTQAALGEGVPVWSEALDNTAVSGEVGQSEGTTAAFAKAAYVVELNTAVQRVTGSPMEPRAALGNYDTATRRYTLFTSTGGSVRLRQDLAHVLNVPLETVRVVAGDVGGNFGTRGGTYPEAAIVLFASKLIGRPVKWTGTRSECFLSDYQARDLAIEAELALDAKGKFLALRGNVVSNVGAYPISFGTLQKSVAVMTSIYHVPHAYIRARAVFSNTPPTRPYRATGRPEAMFVMERLIDLAARETGIDRLKLRRLNLVTTQMHPYTNPLGTTYDNGDFHQALDQALTLGDWAGHAERRKAAKARGKCLGIGVATYVDTGTGVMRERADVTVHSRGQIDLAIGTVSNGQGHETSFAQLITEWLGVPVNCVRLLSGDTDAASTGGGSHSGRSMRLGAVIIKQAAEAIIMQGVSIASHLLEAAEQDIAFAEGRFTLKGTDRSFGLFDIATAAETNTSLPESLQGPLAAACDEANAPPSFPYGSHVCEVEIDPETGEVTIVRYAAVDDVGRAVNPMIIHGQTHGGIAQGVGQALLEKSSYDSDTGQLYAASFMDYAMPRASSVPMFDTLITEVPSASHPLGMRSGGEGGTAPALAVITNAVVDALSVYGITHIDMPATPDRIWEAIEAAKKASAH